jgi:hypothetical protein
MAVGAVRRGWFVRLLAIVLGAAALLNFPTVANAAASQGSISVTATVNGQSVSHSDENDPVRLEPAKPARIVLQVFNSTPRSVNVRTVELQGRVIGLIFYSFDTSVGLTVRAHSSATLRYVLDLSGLTGQATGLIPGSVSIQNAKGGDLASVAMVSDVRGSIVSVYGLFGLALLILTLLALMSTLLSVARHRLPANRFRRAVHFLVPGVGIGLVIAFTLSALRVWLPTNGLWLVAILIAAAASFGLGILSPTPLQAHYDEDEDETEEANGSLLPGDSPSASVLGAAPGPAP